MSSVAPRTPPAEIFHLGYRPALDGLRAIAVLMVMLEHFDLPDWYGGFLGVDVFFVLSGFLITSLLVEEWETTGKIRMSHFYARRALRLLPAVIVVLIVTARFVPRILTVCAFFYVANWPIAFHHFRGNPINHLWSLSVEEQFYFVWPMLLVTLLSARASRAAILTIVGLLAAGSAAYKILAWHETSSWVRLYHGSDARADTLLVGCALGLLVTWRMLPKSHWFRVAVRVAALPAAVGFGYMCLTSTIKSESLYHHGGLSLAAVAIGIILMQVMVAPIRPITAFLEWRPIVGIGRISYGLYLWHHVVAWVPNPWIFGTIPPIPLFVARVVLTFAAALTSYFVIERPMLGLKRRFASDSAARAARA